MKKKTATSKLSIDKETVANLNFENLSREQTDNVQGGAGTYFTSGGVSCCVPPNFTAYTSCG